MQFTKLSFSQIPQLSYKDKTYQEDHNSLQDFYRYSPDLAGVNEAIDQRPDYTVDRALLVHTLTEQYTKINIQELQSENLNKLKNNNCFTVITAHQPCLFTGPAYYFYKIFSTVKLCRILQNERPDCNFVPVFVSGSEDHDFEEIKHLEIFGNRIEWQSNQRGSVGRFTTEGLQQCLDELSPALGNSIHANKLKQILTTSLEKAQTYNEFVFALLNALFGHLGVIVFNMDNEALKKAFIPIMEKELIERISEKFVLDTQEELQKIHFKPQAFPRDINLFYMRDQSRERIYFEDNLYKINNTDLFFTQEEIITELHQHPDRFSPNVILRPVYQEFILPNIAYIGGGGEVSYWLERKTQFEAFGVFFPVILRRNSLLIVPYAQQKTIHKLHLSIESIFMDENDIINKHILSSTDTDIHLQNEAQLIQKAFEIIAEKAKSVDPTLEHYVLGEGTKLVRAVEQIEGRLKRSLKQKEEVAVNQIRNLKSKLFPSGGLQERNESFFQFLVSEGFDWMDELADQCNPLDKSFLVLLV